MCLLSREKTGNVLQGNRTITVGDTFPLDRNHLYLYWVKSDVILSIYMLTSNFIKSSLNQ